MNSEEQIQETKGSGLWKSFATIIFLAQAIASAVLFVKAFLLGMIPDKYIYGFGIALWLLLMISALMLFVGMKRPRTASRTIRRLIAVLLSIAICFASVAGYSALDKVKSALNAVTGEQQDSDNAVAATMNLYVISNDPAKKAADCKDYIIGVSTGTDSRNSKAALTKMSEETGVSVQSKDYDSESDMITALYKGEVKAMIMNSSQADILSDTEEFQDFKKKTRLIREYEITNADLALIPGDPDADNGDASLDDRNAVQGDITRTPFIVYLSGSDTRNKKFKTSRSDVNILMVVNPNTKQILLLNTPRDYYVPNPKSSTGERDKLTHLGLYGVGCSMKGLGNLYGCTINYSVQINFTGMETLVDQLGGVTIYNSKEFKAWNGGYKFKKGNITLNGKEAVAYARERYAFSSGDNMRGQNQMKIITAMINKMTASKSQVLRNYSGIMNALSGMFRTSMPTSDIEKLVKMQLSDNAEWKITQYAVTGKSGSEKSYSSPKHKAYVMWPDEKSVNEGADKIKKVLAGETI